MITLDSIRAYRRDFVGIGKKVCTIHTMTQDDLKRLLPELIEEFDNFTVTVYPTTVTMTIPIE
jgi:hypothetical protein